MWKVAWLLALVLLASCASHFTQNQLEQVAFIKPGMSRADVEKYMGTPALTENIEDVVAVHYCKTGVFNDDMVSIILNKDKVVAVKNYRINSTQASGSPDCSSNIILIKFGSAQYMTM